MPKEEKKPTRKAVKIVKKKAPAKKAATKKTTKKEVITEQILHTLVPLHEKVSDTEKKQVFEKYKVTIKQMPRILISDVAIRHLAPKEGDIIKITRPSLTSGTSVFYRCVVSE